MSKIYIVKSSEGEYEDYHEWNEKAFVNKEDAVKYAKELDTRHRGKPQFLTDDFCNALDDCRYKLPDWEDFPEGNITAENKERYFTWVKEQEANDLKWLIDQMYEKGFFMTEQMFKDCEEYESRSYTQWYDCTIEELELV